jgi:hypothetical protein
MEGIEAAIGGVGMVGIVVGFVLGLDWISIPRPVEKRRRSLPTCGARRSVQSRTQSGKINEIFGQSPIGVS